MFAEEVEKEFSTRAKRKSRGVKQAPFYVISRTNMPSVLIEIGFLTCPQEEKYLNSKEGQEDIANSIFEALRRLTGVSFSNMLLVDSDIATLEAARGLGMSTVLMQSQVPIPSGFTHPKIEGFAELFGK